MLTFTQIRDQRLPGCRRRPSWPTIAITSEFNDRWDIHAGTQELHPRGVQLCKEVDRKAARSVQGHDEVSQLKGHRQRTESTLSTFEVTFVNSMVLVLDRPFVHRLRSVTGEEGKASTRSNCSVTHRSATRGSRGKFPIDYIPERSVLKLEAGDSVRPTESEFERLASAFFVGLKSKYT